MVGFIGGLGAEIAHLDGQCRDVASGDNQMAERRVDTGRLQDSIMEVKLNLGSMLRL